MFAFDTTPVKFIGLLLLFVWCTLWCGYELTRPQDGRQRVSNVLHLGMAVVMLAMVPRGTWQLLTGLVPTPVLVLLFALATAWFLGLSIGAFRRSDRRGFLHFAGHAAMFAAMAWHLAAMAAMAAGASGMGGMGHDAGHGTGMDHGHGMEPAGQADGVMWTFALVGVPFMAYLLAASVRALVRVLQPRAAVNDDCPCGAGCTCGPECSCATKHAPADQTPARALELVGAGSGPHPRPTPSPSPMAHSCHEERPVGTAKYRLAASSDVAMNFGMFWMSTGLLVPLLPFFAALAF